MQIRSKARSASVLLISAGLGLSLNTAQASQSQTAALTSGHHLSTGQQQKIAGLSLPFIENTGQVDARVAFYASTFAGTAFVTHSGKLVLSLPGKPRSGDAEQRGPGWVLTESPITDSKLQPKGDGIAPTRVSVFQGSQQRHWRHNLKSFHAVSLGQPWPGIGYRIQAHGDNVERVFTVNPGAKAQTIRMQVRGARALSLEHDRLVAHTPNGPVTLSKPVAFQTIDGQRRPVQVAYNLKGAQYGFKLGLHDKHYPVVIDPLIQATYLGGSYSESINAMTIGSSGEIYVTGRTFSTDFPGTTGGALPTRYSTTGPALYSDAFVAKLSADLKAILQATYFGGSSRDEARSLALGSNDQVYIAGWTQSPDLPGATGGAQATTNTQDGFVAEFSNDLTHLIQTTYLGGSGQDSANTLAYGNGQIYVGGDTNSNDFPGTVNGAQTSMIGNGAYFIARLSPDLTHIVQSTYLGDSAAAYSGSMTTSPSGQVYFAGDTVINTAANPASSTSDSHFFIAELNPDLTKVDHAINIACSGSTMVTTLSLSPSGQIYAAGSTSAADLPGTQGAAQPTYDQATDGFITALNSDLSAVQRTTYLGGSDTDGVTALLFDHSGHVYAAGYTKSTDFPLTTGSEQPNKNTQGDGQSHDATGHPVILSDGFIAKLSTDLRTLYLSTYYGGSGNDSIVALAQDGTGTIYAAGSTSSTDLAGTNGGAQTSSSGTGGFIARFGGLLQLGAAGPIYNSAPASGTSLAFGDTALGHTSASKRVRIVNPGTENLTLNAQITGNRADQFKIVAAPATSLTADGSTDIQIACTPTTTGDINASLDVENNGSIGVTTASYPLTCHGLTADKPTISGLNDISVTAATADSSNFTTSSGFTITGQGSLKVTATSSNQALLPDANITGASSCTAAGSCTLTLKPVANVSGSATIKVNVVESSGPSTSDSFTFSVQSASSSGGGGAFGLLGLLMLTPLIAARRQRNRPRALTR